MVDPKCFHLCPIITICVESVKEGKLASLNPMDDCRPNLYSRIDSGWWQGGDRWGCQW